VALRALVEIVRRHLEFQARGVAGDKIGFGVGCGFNRVVLSRKSGIPK
jgi:hypothetical protein